MLHIIYPYCFYCAQPLKELAASELESYVTLVCNHHPISVEFDFEKDASQLVSVHFFNNFFSESQNPEQFDFYAYTILEPKIIFGTSNFKNNGASSLSISSKDFNLSPYFLCSHSPEEILNYIQQFKAFI